MLVRSLVAIAACVMMCVVAEGHGVSRVTYYGAAPVVVAPAPIAPVVAYRPVVAPTTVYYAPTPYAVSYAPAPVIVPAPAAVVPVATPVVTTRRRPILGGTVTRVRNYYGVAVAPLY